MLTGRYLAVLAWEWSHGQHDRVERLLRAQGKQIEKSDGAWTVRFDGGFTCGLLLDSEPTDALIQLMFALLGPMWPLAVGRNFDVAMDLISKALKEERRKTKEVTKDGKGGDSRLSNQRLSDMPAHVPLPVRGAARAESDQPEAVHRQGVS